MKSGASQRGKSPRVAGRDRDHRIGEPAEPLEEIVRVPRPAPQACVAHPALVGRIVAKAFELGVGDPLTGDAGKQDQRAEIVLQAERADRHLRGEKDRKHQRHRAERLLLQKDEHFARRGAAPLLCVLGVAGIVVVAGRAYGNVQSEPQGPGHDQRRHHELPRRQARLRQTATAPRPRRRSRSRTSRWYRPSRNCRCAAGSTQATAISVPSAAAIAASAITNGRTIGPCLQ